jgi:hypothetical protein
VLPAIIERRYRRQSVLRSKKDKTAAERFTQVLALIADSDLRASPVSRRCPGCARWRPIFSR